MTAALLVLTALAVASPWLAALAPAAQAAISALALVLGLRGVARTRKLAGLAISARERRWYLAYRGAKPAEVALEGHALVGPVASLRFRLADGRRWPIVVVSDAVSPDSFRQLRSLLKAGAGAPRDDGRFQ